MLYFAAINPIAIQIGPWPIYWYGLIIGSAIFLSLYLAIREANRLEINPDYFVDVVMYGIPIAIICARAYYVIFRWDFYSQNPSEIIAIWHGGMAIHGGLIGAVIVGYVYTRSKKISFWTLADIAAPSILLGQAIGRWGNFINQEAHGGVITEKYQWLLNVLPNFISEQMNIDGLYYHPTFLYESIWSFIGVILLMFWFRRLQWVRRGEVFLGYFIWYSIGRFFIEGLRTDSLMITNTLRAAQFISIAIIITAVVIIVYRRKTNLAAEKYGKI